VSDVVTDGAAGLAAFLREQQGRVRLLGSGTRQRRLPPPPAGAARVSLSGLDGIERLVRDDLTCSVGAGLSMQSLRAALDEQQLELGFDGGGTVGGHFAHDPLGAAVPGMPSPRSTLLGLEGVLADGTVFKAGARVVKSVAGYDVHRLFPGSRGRLFAATLLHLKLRPRPRCSVAFACAPQDLDAALPRFLALRRLAPPPRQLALDCSGAGCCVRGRLAGRAAQVAATMREHGLREAPAPGPDHLDGGTAGREIVGGIVRPSRVRDLLLLLPAPAHAIVHAGGRFEAELAPPQADRLLAALPGLEAAGALVEGGRAGLSTPADPGAGRLERALAQALDPRGVFA
jgi:FAD/FMN-containing dehydrogenase